MKFCKQKIADFFKEYIDSMCGKKINKEKLTKYLQERKN